MDLLSLSAVELAAAIKAGQTTALEAVQAVLDEMEKKETDCHCYITTLKEQAYLRAEQVQRQIEAGELKGALAGVPVAVKDNLCTAGVPTTCASKMLEHFVPGYSAEAVKRLEEAGAIIIGKTNMDEFAFGSTTETSYFGVTRNPHNLKYVPGGSSGGSAAAVAAGECFFAIGSDTGGSIRQPAAHCGVVGMKPTYGTVSRYGLVAYASSMDQIGPLGKSVEDCAAILEVLAGYDAKDSTSVKRSDMDFTEGLKRNVEGIRIGIPNEYMDGLDEEVRTAVLAAAELLKKQGAVVEQFDLGLTDYAVPAYYIIAMAEAASNLERFDGVKYGYRAMGAKDLQQMYVLSRSQGFGTEVKHRLMLGNFVLSAGFYEAYYLKALKVKALIKKNFDRVFQAYDCILGPVAPTTAPKLGESLSAPLKMYLSDIYTIPANLAGLPGISIPCGKDSSEMPIGLQLVGDCFQEKKLLQVAYTYEQAAKEVE